MKVGPKGEDRLSTRFAGIVATIAKRHPGLAIPVPLADIARTLRCSRDTLRKLSKHLRESAWFFQGYHTIIFLTHETTEKKPRGFPVLWCINRHSLHRIYAAPGKWRQLRWHWRHGSHKAWNMYMRWIEKLAFAMLGSKKKTSDGKHKGFSHGISDRANGARSPTNRNRPAWRRYGGIAAQLEAAYAATVGGPTIKLFGWLVNRLSEQHERGRIVASLKHACTLLQKHQAILLENPASWVCEVARRWLERDGLLPIQRYRDRYRDKKRQGAEAPAFNKVSKIEPIKQHSKYENQTCYYLYRDRNGKLWHRYTDPYDSTIIRWMVATRLNPWEPPYPECNILPKPE